jgi:hypothetical protein
MRTMYAAAATDDLAKFHTVAAPDFYAFDGGTRYDGDALMNTLKSLHASGKVYVWTVTQPYVDRRNPRANWLRHSRNVISYASFTAQVFHDFQEKPYTRLKVESEYSRDNHRYTHRPTPSQDS